jgi:XTP/dITP diphosphohydrolase
MKFDSIVLATTNQKKIGEMRRLLTQVGLTIADVDVASAPEVDESGQTFAANAAIKAIAQAKHFKLHAIGEDSGLVVPAIGGEPGIYSARYAGRTSNIQKENDEANIDLLLQKMSNLRGDDRMAYYVSSIALADASGNVVVAVEDRCYGVLLEERRGSGGFGYDPLFIIREYHRTFAELPLAVKSAISHRGRALRKFIRELQMKPQRHKPSGK